MINKINYREDDFELVSANSNYKFSIADPVWVLDKNVRLNITIILGKLHVSHHCDFLNTLSFFATTKSASYTKKMFWAFNDFLKSSEHGLITDLSVASYHKQALINKADHL
ncbi:site-specific integrase, partial [Pectobacterium betavasculorum]